MAETGPGRAAGGDRLAFLALTATALFFAGNTIVGRAVAETLPPFGLAFWRSFGAFLILAPFGLPGIWARRREILAAWRILAILGVLGMTAFSALVFAGLRYTEALNGALIQGTLPLAIVALSALMLGLRIGGRQVLGLAAGGAGFALIVLRGDPGGLAALGLNAGDGMILLGVVCHALFSILLARRPAALGLPAFLTVAFFVGAATTFPLHAWELWQGRPMPLSWTAVAAAGYVALFASVLGQLFWAVGVGRIGAARAGYFMYLTPVFGAAIAVAALGESVGWYHPAGIAAIFAGIWLATGRGAKAG